MSATRTPAVYVGTYRKYNQGSIQGKWMYFSQYSNADEFLKACYELHYDESDPELMFQDHMDIPETVYSECMGKDTINFLIQYSKLENSEQEKIEDFVQYHCSTEGRDIEDILDMCLGKYESERDYCIELMDFTMEMADEEVNGLHTELLRDALRFYIDYDAMARSLFVNDFFIGKNGYVFTKQ